MLLRVSGFFMLEIEELTIEGQRTIGKKAKKKEPPSGLEPLTC